MYPEQSPFSVEHTPEKFVLTYVLPTCLRAASKCGINVLEFVQDMGVSPLTLIPGHGVLPMKELFNLLGEGTRAGWAAQPGGHIPLIFADSFQFDYLPDATACLLTSPNLIEASKVFNWVSVLYCPPASFEFHMNQDLITVVLTFEEEFSDPHTCWPVSEAILATWYRFACRLSSSVETPHRVEFRHQAHPMRGACDEFFGVKCEFGALRDAITLKRQWLEAPLEASVPLLHDHAKASLKTKLSKVTHDRRFLLDPQSDSLDEFGIARKVFDHLTADESRLALDLTETAAALELATRSLQRRLQDAGTSFTNVQAKARLFVAKRLLLDAAVPVASVAARVGFPDRRSFASFFKRQTGQTPHEWRQSRQR